MATVTYRPVDADTDEQLRRDARQLLHHGVPPRLRSGTLGVDALRLLYQRASEPESAADALKLLHELQTFQVELDLMYQQLQANEHELINELARYRSLFDRAPVAYLVVDRRGDIVEVNHAALSLLGESARPGQALSRLLQPGQALPMPGSSGHLEPISAQNVTLADGRVCIARMQPATRGSDALLILTGTADPVA